MFQGAIYLAPKCRMLRSDPLIKVDKVRRFLPAGQTERCVHMGGLQQGEQHGDSFFEGIRVWLDTAAV
jgi:hypothetical protein